MKLSVFAPHFLEGWNERACRHIVGDMLRMRTILGIGLVLLAACHGGQPLPQARHPRRLASAEELKSAFNADRGSVRLIVLLDPG